MKEETKEFLSLQATIGASVLFFILFWGHVKNIYINVTANKPASALNNITEDKAEVIKTELEDALYSSDLKNNLRRYFVFLYTDDYKYREFFISSNGVLPQNTKQATTDLFYKNMLSFHRNNNCYVSPTTTIKKESKIYNNLMEAGDIAENIFYVSCPVFLDSVLIGYIGGLSEQEEFDYIHSQTVKNTADTLEKILLNGS